MVMKTFNGLFHAHERISYRRLLAFAAGTGLLLADKLTGDQWIYVCVAFIAGEAAPKMMEAVRGGK